MPSFLLKGYKKMLLNLTSTESFNSVASILYKSDIKLKNDGISIETINMGKKEIDNVFSFKSIMNLHYTNINQLYFTIENKISSFTGIYKFPNNSSVSESFIRDLINLDSDIYLEVVNPLKSESVKKLKNSSYMYKILIQSKENEMRVNRQNAETIQSYIDFYNQRKNIIDTMYNNLTKNVLSTASYLYLGIRKNLPSNSQEITDNLIAFGNYVSSQGFELQPNSFIQHRNAFNYIHGYENLEELHFIFQNNLATGRLYPFVFPNYIYNSQVQNNIILGNYLDNSVPIFDDIWNLPAYNGIIIGTTGSGKSATSKSFLIRNYLMKNRKIIVIDLQNEYLYTSKLLNGVSIDILNAGKSGILKINLFDMNISFSETNSLSDKINTLIKFFDLAIQSDINKSPLKNASEQMTFDIIENFYFENGFSEGSSNNIELTFDDFKNYIDKMNDEFNRTKRVVFGNTTYRLGDLNYQKAVEVLGYLKDVINLLSDSDYKIFKGKTNIDFSNDFIVFNIKNLPEKLMKLALYVILEYIQSQMYRDKDRQKIILLDEAWFILSSFGADYIRTIAKTSRKFNTALILTTQQLSDFTRKENAEQGKALLENIYFSYLYNINTDENISDEIKSQFNLNDDDIFFLKNYAGINKAGKDEIERASAGILLLGRNKYRIKYILTKKELSVCESNPDELKEIIPKDIINYRNELTALENQNNKTSNKDVIKKNLLRIDYLNSMISTLREIEDELNLKTSYDEEAIRDFVIAKSLIYTTGISPKSSLFGDGINSDERIYLLENSYSEIRTIDYPFLEEVFDNEIFYVKESVGNKAIFILLNFIKSFMLSKYANSIYNGIVYVQQNNLQFETKTSENIVSDIYYLFNPKTKTSIETDFKKKEKKVENKSLKYFTKDELSDGRIHIINLRTNEKFSVLEDNLDGFIENISRQKNSVIIKIETEYFTQFTNDELEQNNCYYLLSDSLYNEQLNAFETKDKKTMIQKNIYNINEYEDLIKDVFKS
jgi:hypothetical protein